MRLPVVSRSELERARSEREEWRRRAQPRLLEETATAEPRRSGRRLGRSLPLFLSSLLVFAVGLGAVTLPDRSAGRPDYPVCIGQARYQEPIEGNQYQELVNALYACGIYDAGSTAG
jgi:ferric-dicitrate binding protein FerR (iron transport regulator)